MSGETAFFDWHNFCYLLYKALKQEKEHCGLKLSAAISMRFRQLFVIENKNRQIVKRDTKV